MCPLDPGPAVSPVMLAKDPLTRKLEVKRADPVVSKRTGHLLSFNPRAREPAWIPDDEVPNSAIGLERARARAEERYPVISPVTAGADPTLRQIFTQDVQHGF